MVKLSIIMPVYNSSDYLEKSLNSILKQSIDDIEIICVNDGSVDNSLNILQKYGERYEYLKVFNQENHGSGISRNQGIKKAKGEYIAFLDADDIYIDSDALKTMYEVAINNDAEIVCANLRKIKSNGQIEEEYDYKNAPFRYFDDNYILNANEYGIPWAFYKNIYKKDFILENDISFPNLKVGEDPIFLANVLTRVEKIYTVNNDLYGYNHSLNGGLNVKINTYQKKKDYICHFIECFNILEKKGFEEVLADYKKELINYLNFRENINNSDIISIIQELFGHNKYYDESDYGYLIMDLIINDTISDDEYDFIKYCIFEESMLEDTFIESDRLKEFLKVSKDNSNNNKKSSFKQLKKIESNAFEEKRQINGEVDRLKLNITKHIKSNDLILTSNSWKLTGFLRNIKHKSEE